MVNVMLLFYNCLPQPSLCSSFFPSGEKLYVVMGVNPSFLLEIHIHIFMEVCLRFSKSLHGSANLTELG